MLFRSLDFQSNAIDTIGGLVIENIGTIPNDYVNKEIIINCIKFKILSLDGKRIEKIQLSM